MSKREIKKEKHKNPMKYSEIFHNFMYPLINEVKQDEDKLKSMLDWGQFIWNKAVAEDFPDNSNSEDIETLFPLFFETSSNKSLVSEYLQRKKKLFSQKNFFIVEQTLLLDADGGLVISVSVLDLDDYSQ